MTKSSKRYVLVHLDKDAAFGPFDTIEAARAYARGKNFRACFITTLELP